MENFKYHPERIKHVPGQEGPIIDSEKAERMAEIEDGYHELAEMYTEYLTKPKTFLEQYPATSPLVERYIELAKQADEIKERERRERRENKEVIFSVSLGAFETPLPKVPEHEMAVLSGDSEVAAYINNPEKYLEEHPTTSAELAHFADMQNKGISSEYIKRIGEMAAEVKGAAEDYEAAVMGKSTKELKQDRRRAWMNLSLGVVEAVLAGDKNAHHMEESEEHMELNQSPDYYNALSKAGIATAIKDSAREQLMSRKPGPNYDYGAMERAFDQFVPQIRKFVETKNVTEVTADEIDALIDASSNIELPGRRQSYDIFKTLIDLRIALFRPEMSNILEEGNTPESLWQELKEAVS